MLPPDYYEDCADDIVELYSKFDEAVISDITRRIVKTGTVTETAKWQIKQAQEMGLLYSDILREIAKRTDATTVIVKALFEDAGVKAVKIDGEAYRKAGKVPVDIRQSPAMLQVLEAGYKKTLGNMKNLTLTTANTSQTAYINACNSAYMKVSSGAFSYQEAIKQAIQETAQHGTTVLYPSGHTDRIDVAVRRSVMTGLGQTCRQISLTNAEEMDCDLLEISAHSGARPSHAVWQGQIVSRSGRQGYLSLSDIGFGTGEGFGGWNCQHDWYPYFEGISTRNYTQAELDALNEKSIEYNGKMYTEYEISQIQRRYEREIRAAKREQTAYKTAVEESNGELKEIMQTALTHSNDVVKDRQAKMRDFIRQTGQQRDYFREQNYGKVFIKDLISSENKDIIITRIFHTEDDPMREVLGSAFQSHPDKVKELLEYLNSVNVEVLIRDENESLGYQPSVSSGNPGQIVLNKKASISAWLHEVQHVRDDEASGWIGMRTLFTDPEERYQWEVRAYNQEIQLAKQLGREDMVKRLEELLENERKRIFYE